MILILQKKPGTRKNSNILQSPTHSVTKSTSRLVLFLMTFVLVETQAHLKCQRFSKYCFKVVCMNVCKIEKNKYVNRKLTIYCF